MNQLINRLERVVINQSTLYIISNIVVNCIGFIRSFIFMRWLNLEDLGLISLMLTCMQFLSFLQLGFFNGGFRYICYGDNYEYRNVNNVIWTYWLAIVILAAGVTCCVSICNIDIVLSPILLILSIFGGLVMLIQNWLTNVLIASRQLMMVNALSLLSVMVTMCLLPLVFYYGFNGACVVVLIQPLIFVVSALILKTSLLPTKISMSLILARKILKVGFIPFLSGIFVLLNLQFERWSIAEGLGAESLGRFYMVSLYVTMSLLVPNAINNLFLPRLITAYESSNKVGLIALLKKMIFIFSGYCLLLVIMTIVLLKPIVVMAFPQHVDNIKYVYLYMPAIILNTLTYVPAVMFNAVLKQKVILYIEGISSIFYIVTLICISYFGYLSLIAVCIIRGILYLMILLLYIAAIVNKRHTLLDN